MKSDLSSLPYFVLPILLLLLRHLCAAARCDLAHGWSTHSGARAELSLLMWLRRLPSPMGVPYLLAQNHSYCYFEESVIDLANAGYIFVPGWMIHFAKKLQKSYFISPQLYSNRDRDRAYKFNNADEGEID